MISTNNIHRLRFLCGGVGNDPLAWHHPDAIKNCEVLLNIEGFERILNNPQVASSSWIRLGNVLLPLIHRSEKIRITFFNLLKLILNHKDVNGRDEFLLKIWNNAALSTTIPLEITILEEFVKNEPKYIESKIIDIIEEIFSRDNLRADEINTYWSDDRFSVLIKWCLESSVIFSIVTSILNEILLRVTGESFRRVLYLIMCFVFNVSNRCLIEDKQFVNLYPCQYRHLVYLLKCEPILNCKSVFDKNIEVKLNDEILPIIQGELEDEPEVVVALLSHYLAWSTDKSF